MRYQDLRTALGILLALAMVLLGSYFVTRWAGMGLGARFGASGGRHVRLLERVPMGRDQSLVVVQVMNRYFLLGSSPSGFSLLAELTEEEVKQCNRPPSSDGPSQGGAPDFRALLRKSGGKK